MNIVDEIINKYKTNNSLYIGEKITISNHMIQTAMLAEKDNSPKSLVCSCLLHDMVILLLRIQIYWFRNY